MEDIDLRAFGLNYETESAEERTITKSGICKIKKPSLKCYNKEKENYNGNSN